jgi:hypothetical protein
MAEDPQLRSWGKGGFLESSSMLRTQGLNIVRGGEKRGIYQHAPSSGRVRWDNRDQWTIVAVERKKEDVREERKRV